MRVCAVKAWFPRAEIVGEMAEMNELKRERDRSGGMEREGEIGEKRIIPKLRGFQFLGIIYSYITRITASPTLKN